MEKKSNIFVAHTEYHVLISVSIILSKYKEYNNYIYYSKGRIKEGIDSTKDCISFISLDSRYGTKETFDEMISHNPSEFFFFQEWGSDNLYLCYWMKRHGVSISLVQDGMKPYAQWHKSHKLLSAIKDTLVTYKDLFRKQSFVWRLIPMFGYDYGRRYYIDKIWLSSPKAYQNKYNKKILELPSFSDEIIDELNHIFSFNPIGIDSDAVLIIGQCMIDEGVDEDVRIINDIACEANKFKKVYFKPHPLTKDNHLKALKAIPYLTFVEGHFPVELLILRMGDTAIISGYCTSMLTYNGRSRYYWTYKIYDRNRLTSQFELINPTMHIKEIRSISEIEF